MDDIEENVMDDGEDDDGDHARNFLNRNINVDDDDDDDDDDNNNRKRPAVLVPERDIVCGDTNKDDDDHYLNSSSCDDDSPILVQRRPTKKARKKKNEPMYGCVEGVTTIRFYDMVDKYISGKEVRMSSFSGNVLLLVNVASYCSRTKDNYIQLPTLFDTYGKRGFRILAFPCNQFGSQEPGTNEEIVSYVQKTYGYSSNNNNSSSSSSIHEKILFFEKADVNGDSARDLYKYLKNWIPNPDDDSSSDIQWNFEYFLIDHKGNPFKRYNNALPNDVRDDIEILLKNKEDERS